jgi:peptidoglycan/xylan/chitin deacetylase (PgdA/CDA1 family)
MKEAVWYSVYLFMLTAMLSCRGKAQMAQDHTALHLSENRFVCFLYHRFGDARFPSTNVSLNDFESHLRYLADNGFTVLTLSDAMAYLYSDEPAKKVAVITIDDGYRSFSERGLPMLTKYNLHATLFINTETVGAADYMNWAQLESAIASGIEIGNHTHSHAYFLNEAPATRYRSFEQDIRKSQDIIRDRLGIEPAIFAFPYGEFDEQMKEVVREIGFDYAAAQNSGVVYAGTDRYQIPRFPMTEALADPAQFAEKASMRPLRIIRQTPGNTVLPGGEPRPELSLTIHNEGLQTRQLQCFVQGGGCELKIVSETTDEVSITVRAANDLTRRRTLYTITVPDSSGSWHWYSHLWINNEVVN